MYNISEHLHSKGYNFLTDDELVRLVKLSDEIAFKYLYEKYLPKIRTMVYSFQGLGYDREDLIQEATVGFYSAIYAYDFSSASFSTFCYICMRRMLLALVKKNFRKGNVPDEFLVSMNTDDILLDSGVLDPEQEYIAKESYYRLQEKISELLSDFEREVLLAYLKGLDYGTISRKLNVSVKSVDNALQRARKKLS